MLPHVRTCGSTSLRSVPLLRLRPERLQRGVKVAAEKNIEMLIAPRVRVIAAARHFHAGEVLAVAAAVAAEDDDALTGVIPRPPKPITLMGADRFRKSVLLAEEIDRAGLAVTVRENCRHGALFERKFIVNPRDFTSHLFPAKFVGKMLRQWTGGLVLSLERRQAQRLLISDISLDWQDRRDGWRQQAGCNNDQGNVNRAAPVKPRPGDIFKCHRAGGKEHRVGGGEVVIFSF